MDASSSTRSILTYAFAVLLILGIPLLQAEPEVTAAALRIGSSPKLTASNWAYLTYTLKNPDSVERIVRLSLRPSNQGAQAIFEKEITLAPHTFVRGRELVTASPVDEYTLSLFRGEKRIVRTTLFCRHTDPADELTLFLLNDDLSFGGTSDLMRSHAFSPRVAVINCSARNAPHHWAGYGHADIVAVAAPAYRDMSAMQFSALVEYVHRGGTAVFVHPKGALEALVTPLRELLPATPVRIRKVEQLPPLEKWAADWHQLALKRSLTNESRVPYESPDGIEFLETTPDAKTFVTLSEGEFPICCWRSHGLGRVGLVAVNASTDLVKASTLLVPLWQHITSWSQAPFVLSYHENSRLLQPLMAKLTGFKIPSVSVVTKTLLVYALVLIVVLVSGYCLRKHAQAWVAAAAIGLIMTGGIFWTAFKQNLDRPVHSAGIIDLRASTGERTTGHAVLSLFSRKDSRPTISETDPENAIRALPPAVRGKRKSPMNAPLMIKRNHDRAELPSIYMQALKPRHFASVYTRKPVKLETSPELHLTPDGPKLTPYSLPDDVCGSRPKAWIVMPNGLISTSVKGNRVISLNTGTRTFEADTFQRALEEYLGCGRFPSPSLAVASDWDNSKDELSLHLGEFQTTGFHVEFLPISLRRDGDAVHIPSEMYVMKPATAYAKLVMQDGKWITSTLRRQNLVIPLRVQVPPYLADGEIEKARVDLNISTPGENIICDVAFGLEPIIGNATSGLPEDMGWSKAVKADGLSGNTFTFSDLPTKGVHASQYPDETLVLLLRLSQKQFMTDHSDAERANIWKILSIELQTLTSLSNTGSSRAKEL